MKNCPKCKQEFADSLISCPVDNAILELELSTLVGKIVNDRYQIMAVIGQGGMGMVYRARDLDKLRTVALKVMPPHLNSNRDYLRRFEREAQIAQRFTHPSSVALYDFFISSRSEEISYMALEYIDGQTLRDEMDTQVRYTPQAAFNVLAPVMLALQAAHDIGIVHRDIKPENIMIGMLPSGQRVIKLLDLGIAKLHQMPGSAETVMTALTATGQLLGTPAYMSPEQWENISDIDGRSDIYSLGILFYELITGELPFDCETIYEMIDFHMFKIPPLLHTRMTNVPKAFGEAIAQAMAKQRDQRPRSFTELMERLSEALPLEERDSIADQATLQVASPFVVPAGDLPDIDPLETSQTSWGDAQQTNLTTNRAVKEKQKTKAFDKASLVDPEPPQNSTATLQSPAMPILVKVKANPDSLSEAKTPTSQVGTNLSAQESPLNDPLKSIKLILMASSVVALMIFIAGIGAILQTQPILATGLVVGAALLYFAPRLILRNQIEDINNQALINGLKRIEENFRETQADQYFRIPGVTPLNRWRNLTEALINLDKKSKRELYKSLEN